MLHIYTNLFTHPSDNPGRPAPVLQKESEALPTTARRIQDIQVLHIYKGYDCQAYTRDATVGIHKKYNYWANTRSFAIAIYSATSTMTPSTILHLTISLI
jgi:hypothetical protein